MGLLLYCSFVYFFFYLVNHASLFEVPRHALRPALPDWMKKSLECAFCFAFWCTSAISLFVGFTPLLYASPVCVMFIELAYQRLKGGSQ